jgi:hydrogenase expression/formation protein HypC
MCLGIPLLLQSVDGIVGTALDGDLPALVDLSLTSEAQPGDWVLCFLGAAREVIGAEDAQKIRAALGGLQSLMLGGDLGAAFADLESRSPSLPPHLQAALDAGRTEA